MKGLHEINTHGTLAREGRLISVARDWHKKVCDTKNDEDGFADNWRVERHIWKKKSSARNSFVPLRRDFLEKIRTHQIKIIEDALQEMRQWAAERIPGSARELDRLMQKLAELQAG